MSGMSENRYERPGRLRLQFPLRSLFILTTLVAAGCLVVSCRIKEYQRQREIQQLRTVLGVVREGCAVVGKEEVGRQAVRRLRELGVQDGLEPP